MKKKALIIVVDHQKARFFHSSDLLHMEEQREDSFESHVVKHSDKPGRTFGRERGALADKNSDREKAEESLAIKLSSYLCQRLNDFDSLYLVTNPKIEGAFKTHCSRGVKLKLCKVIHKRLITKTNQEIWDAIKLDIQHV